MKKYKVRSIDKSAVADLENAIKDCKNSLDKKIALGEIMEKHLNLNEKLYAVIYLRNKSIDEAIPTEDRDILFDLSKMTDNITVKVIYDPIVENLINEALKLSETYSKILTNK